MRWRHLRDRVRAIDHLRPDRERDLLLLLLELRLRLRLRLARRDGHMVCRVTIVDLAGVRVRRVRLLVGSRRTDHDVLLLLLLCRDAADLTRAGARACRRLLLIDILEPERVLHGSVLLAASPRPDELGGRSRRCAVSVRSRLRLVLLSRFPTPSVPSRRLPLAGALLLLLLAFSWRPSCRQSGAAVRV